jgi:predicted protein tyrosine phosphatase
MCRLLICPFSALPETVRRHQSSHLLTLMAEPDVETPEGIASNRHLWMLVHDVAEPALGIVAPCADHITAILAFSRGWDRNEPFLLHCWTGISRSTMAAYILACDLGSPRHEAAIARGPQYHAPHAQPNRLMLRHADELLRRDGRMIAAIAAIGDAQPAWKGEVAALPLTLDES